MPSNIDRIDAISACALPIQMPMKNELALCLQPASGNGLDFEACARFMSDCDCNAGHQPTRREGGPLWQKKPLDSEQN